MVPRKPASQLGVVPSLEQNFMTGCMPLVLSTIRFQWALFNFEENYSSAYSGMGGHAKWRDTPRGMPIINHHDHTRTTWSPQYLELRTWSIKVLKCGMLLPVTDEVAIRRGTNERRPAGKHSSYLIYRSLKRTRENVIAIMWTCIYMLQANLRHGSRVW